jgi:hypothetical protein
LIADTAGDKSKISTEGIRDAGHPQFDDPRVVFRRALSVIKKTGAVLRLHRVIQGRSGRCYEPDLFDSEQWIKLEDEPIS